MNKFKKSLLAICLILSFSYISVASYADEGDIPEWLRRTDFSFEFETDRKPTFFLEAVQPIYQDLLKENTFFVQPRISLQDYRNTYNLGFGYRRLLFEGELLAGVNTFFDYQDLHRHYRAGVGLEAISKMLEARVNSYFGLSPKRLVHETSTSSEYQKAVDGMDAELGGPVPFLPWLKLFGSYYRYNYEQFKDKTGWKARAEIKPLKYLTIDLETYDDNKGDQEFKTVVAAKIPFTSFTLGDIWSNLKVAPEPYPEVDLAERTLDPVERSFEIEVEKWVESSGLTIEVGRK